MISIATAYYNRRSLFLRTLESLELHAGPEFELVAVDDGSREEERIEDLTRRFPFLRVIRLEPGGKWYRNPCIPFNLAIRHARGRFIVLQNPECLHAGPVLQHVHAHLRTGTYLSFGCYALSMADTTSLHGHSALEVQARLAALPRLPEAPGSVSAPGWYNHSRHRPCGYHFCCAITRDELHALGGFDERYATGSAYDDDELLHRIKLSGLSVEFVDSPHVYHQNHYTTPGNGIPGPYELRNQRLFQWVTLASTAIKPHDWDWGRGGTPEARAANAALDALLLNNASLEDILQGNSAWQSHLRTRQREAAPPPALVSLLRHGAEAPLSLASSIRKSPLARWFWSRRDEKEFEKARHLFATAKDLEARLKTTRAAEKYLEAHTRAMRAAHSAARRRRWWPGTSRSTLAMLQAQQATLVEAWQSFQATAKGPDHPV